MRRLAATKGTAIALAFASGASAQDSWQCGGAINGDGFSGTYSQAVEAPDLIGPLFVEIADDAGFEYSWSYANRFTDPSYETGLWGRTLVDFETGKQAAPEYVSQIMLEVDRPRRGAMWVHYFGDGDHKLTERWYDRLRVRERFYDRKVSTSFYISRTALTNLVDSELWQIAVTDGAGRTVAEQTFVPVDFQRVRRELDAAMERHHLNISEYRERCEYYDATPVL